MPPGLRRPRAAKRWKKQTFFSVVFDASMGRRGAEEEREGTAAGSAGSAEAAGKKFTPEAPRKRRSEIGSRRPTAASSLSFSGSLGVLSVFVVNFFPAASAEPAAVLRASDRASPCEKVAANLCSNRNRLCQRLPKAISG